MAVVVLCMCLYQHQAAVALFMMRVESVDACRVYTIGSDWNATSCLFHGLWSVHQVLLVSSRGRKHQTAVKLCGT